MAAGARRDDLLGLIALARGEGMTAYEDFYLADDLAGVQQFVNARAQHDLPGAIALEERFREKLIADGTHPDAVADSYEISGNMQALLHADGDAASSYRHAADLAPLNQGYLLTLANLLLVDGRNAEARVYYARTLQVNPASANALAGMGVLALRAGDRPGALRYLSQARAADPRAGMIGYLERALR
jgi:tetratricopeptide (TPR) repeat protein